MNVPDPSAILLLVSSYYDVTVSEMLGPLRNISIVRARHVAMYLIWSRCHGTHGYPEIGRLFGRHPDSVKMARYSIMARAVREPAVHAAIQFLSERVDAMLRTAAQAAQVRTIPTPVGCAVESRLISCRELAVADNYHGSNPPDRGGGDPVGCAHNRRHPPAADNNRAQPTELSTSQGTSFQWVA